MTKAKDHFLEHPAYPYKVEQRGQEFIRHYPEGAEAPSTAEEWLLLILLNRLDAALGAEVAASIDAETPIVDAIAVVEKEVSAIETKRRHKAK